VKVSWVPVVLERGKPGARDPGGLEAQEGRLAALPRYSRDVEIRKNNPVLNLPCFRGGSRFESFAFSVEIKGALDEPPCIPDVLSFLIARQLFTPS
jgi:hypothetical protein